MMYTSSFLARVALLENTAIDKDVGTLALSFTSNVIGASGAGGGGDNTGGWCIFVRNNDQLA